LAKCARRARKQSGHRSATLDSDYDGAIRRGKNVSALLADRVENSNKERGVENEGQTTACASRFSRNATSIQAAAEYGQGGERYATLKNANGMPRGKREDARWKRRAGMMTFKVAASQTRLGLGAVSNSDHWQRVKGQQGRYIAVGYCGISPQDKFKPWRLTQAGDWRAQTGSWYCYGIRIPAD
jgi:hypothetical protein